jgi:hypothetical protein
VGEIERKWGRVKGKIIAIADFMMAIFVGAQLAVPFKAFPSG